jgi:hypothetical protein
MMMTTAQTTTVTDTILAIDLGKYKSVACFSPAINAQSFVKFPTCRAELTKRSFAGRVERPGLSCRNPLGTRASRANKATAHWVGVRASQYGTA